MEEPQLIVEASTSKTPPEEKSNAKPNWYTGDLPDPRYRIGKEVRVSAKGKDGKMRKVKTIVEKQIEGHGYWLYQLKSPPAESRQYKETEIE